MMLTVRSPRTTPASPDLRRGALGKRHDLSCVTRRGKDGLRVLAPCLAGAANDADARLPLPLLEVELLLKDQLRNKGFFILIVIQKCVEWFGREHQEDVETTYLKECAVAAVCSVERARRDSVNPTPLLAQRAQSQPHGASVSSVVAEPQSSRHTAQGHPRARPPCRPNAQTRALGGRPWNPFRSPASA